MADKANLISSAELMFILLNKQNEQELYQIFRNQDASTKNYAFSKRKNAVRHFAA
jgi:hypothetical protein